MIDGEVFAMFLGLAFTALVVVAFVVVFVKIAKSSKTQQRMEQYKQRQAEQQSEAKTSISDELRRRQEELKQRLAKKYGLYDYNERSSIEFEEDKDEKQELKHQKHVEDTHAHGHVGQEEHYEEIIGSLGEVSDEGCADLSGVRFLAHDIAYELEAQNNVDYDRLAQAMVLGEIINTPRSKMPYTRRK